MTESLTEEWRIVINFATTPCLPQERHPREDRMQLKDQHQLQGAPLEVADPKTKLRVLAVAALILLKSRR